MDKNRDLYDKCTKLEIVREELREKVRDQNQRLVHMDEKIAQCTKVLQEERSMHEQERDHLSIQIANMQRDFANERACFKETMEALEGKVSQIEGKYTRQMDDLKANHVRSI